MAIFGVGTGLLSSVRTAISAHTISVERGALTTGPFPASSPPIGHQLVTETGLDISDHNRDFFFDAKHMGILMEPRIGDVIIDQKDKSRWRVLPQDNDYAWNWHGQMRAAYKVTTKQDS